MATNEGMLDRALRALLGIILIGLASTGILETVLAVILVVVGVFSLGTAAAGWSPIYALIHWDTRCRTPYRPKCVPLIKEHSTAANQDKRQTTRTSTRRKLPRPVATTDLQAAR